MRYLVIICSCLLLTLITFFMRKEVKEKREHDSNFIKVPLFIGVFSLICFITIAIIGLCVIIYVNISTALILWSVSLAPLFMLWWYFVYQIEICGNCFEVRSIFFHTKKYYFSEIFLYRGTACLIVQDQYGIERMRISDLYTNTSKLEKAYSSFYKVNRLKKPKRLSNKVTCIKFVRLTIKKQEEI